MNIIVNGEARSLDAPVTISALLETLDVNPLTIVVEHNGTILERDDFGRKMVGEGDTLELIRFVGGG